MKYRYIASIGEIREGDEKQELVYVDVEKEEGQDRSLRDAIFQASYFAWFAVTEVKGKSFALDKLHNHTNYVLVQE